MRLYQSFVMNSPGTLLFLGIVEGLADSPCGAGGRAAMMAAASLLLDLRRLWNEGTMVRYAAALAIASVIAILGWHGQLSVK